jgi:hypothetical protein
MKVTCIGARRGEGRPDLLGVAVVWLAVRLSRHVRQERRRGT